MLPVSNARGIDVPIGQLRPLNERKPGVKSFRRLMASVRAVGLIEPLCIFKAEDEYLILDGYLRYLVCVELGVEKLPCLLYKTKEAYSFNKMVNALSPVQEHRMIRKSLETIDEKTIARSLGINVLGDSGRRHLLSKLSEEAVKAYDATRISRACAECLTFVDHERQGVILKEMFKAGDYTPAFARAMIIRTPAQHRAKLRRNSKNPWDQEDVKHELLQRLNEIEQRYDFYTGLYRQYVADLLKLCIYIRKLITNDRVRAVIKVKYPDILTLLSTIVFDSERSREFIEINEVAVCGDVVAEGVSGPRLEHH